MCYVVVLTAQGWRIADNNATPDEAWRLAWSLQAKGFTALVKWHK